MPSTRSSLETTGTGSPGASSACMLTKFNRRGLCGSGVKQGRLGAALAAAVYVGWNAVPSAAAAPGQTGFCRRAVG